MENKENGKTGTHSRGDERQALWKNLGRTLPWKWVAAVIVLFMVVYTWFRMKTLGH